MTRKDLVACIERNKNGERRGYWTKIGAAFQNRDGSWTLKFDFFPADMTVSTIQMRDPLPPREGGQSRAEEDAF